MLSPGPPAAAMLHRLGRLLARHLAQPRPGYSTLPATTPEDLGTVLQPGDVLLVEGTSRLSTAIKYMTQSTWSHAALYVGERFGGSAMLVEADLVDGVRLVPLSLYADMHTRICRPVGLVPADLAQLLDFVRARVGGGYDLRNVFDLMRYLVRVPVPNRMKRRMLALGSGDPTRAICSTLLAQAFESIRYPILPLIELIPATHPDAARVRREILHIRNYSLFVPRDFDVSPYFQIVKPRLDAGFDYHALSWSDAQASPPEVWAGPDG